jgi:hypothetical protein
MAWVLGASQAGQLAVPAARDERARGTGGRAAVLADGASEAPLPCASRNAM